LIKKTKVAALLELDLEAAGKQEALKYPEKEVGEYTLLFNGDINRGYWSTVTQKRLTRRAC
jgi:hypothetical protein